MTHDERVQHFTECKTILTVMLTVKSGMNSHMISEIWMGLVKSWVGFCRSGFY
jgi:hypothetical protein